MITTFRVQNYKALRDVTLQLTPMHLLIGPNDSGKTSILEALAALSRLTTMDATEAFGPDWRGRELVWNFANESINFTIDEPQHEPLSLKIFFEEHGRSATFGTKASPHQELQQDPGEQEIKDRTRIREIIAKIKAFTSPVERFAFIPSWMAYSAAANPQAPFRLDETGFGLSRCLDYLIGTQRKAFRRLEEQFQQFFPHILEIVLDPEKGMQLSRELCGQIQLQFTHDGKALHFQVDSCSEKIAARQMSDGVLIVLGFLTILSLPDPPKLLLIEEPENGIHPERLEEIIRILRELLKEHPETQVVMTSHSPYIVSLFESQEVTLCRKNDQGEVQVKRLSDSQIVQDQLKVFSLGEIWPAEEERIFKEATGSAPVPAEATP